MKLILPLALAALSLALPSEGGSVEKTGAGWKPGAPIVTYWAGPGFPGGGPLDDKAAAQLAQGGWNLVWCHEKELDAAQRHGLRGLLTDPLLDPASLDDPAKKAALEALVERVAGHPAMYAWHLTDEPSATAFPRLGELVAFLRERAPQHLAYINLLPTYASNAQLGTTGGTVEAYAEHLRLFSEQVKPSLLSYDHYQFTRSGDNPDYFLNLAMVRGQALKTGVPFLNIVQASSWVPGSAASPGSPRVPQGPEMRYLVYTTLAYGAQGISYYVYGYPAHEGGIAGPDGKPTELYPVLRELNQAFTAIAGELQPLASRGAFHTGMTLPGTSLLPEALPVRFDPPVSALPYKAGERVQGMLLGCFGKPEAPGEAATHFLAVNLDYQNARTVTLQGPSPWETFDAPSGTWTATGSNEARLALPGGSGKLLRLVPAKP